MANKKISELVELTAGQVAVDDYIELVDSSAGDNKKAQIQNIAPRTTAIGYSFDGGGSALATGTYGAGLSIPFACTINSVTLLADQSGSVVVDIWKDTYANFPPTNADSICASAKPTLSSARKSVDTTLTGWATSVAAGDVLYFNVDSASTITKLALVLKVTKS